MAAKDIIIARLKWTHTGIYHISMGYGNLLRRFLYSRRARWLSCFLSPFGFIRKLSATLRMLRRTLDIYLCKNVKSFVKLAVIAQPPHPCPYPHSYPWPPTKGSRMQIKVFFLFIVNIVRKLEGGRKALIAYTHCVGFIFRKVSTLNL